MIATTPTPAPDGLDGTPPPPVVPATSVPLACATVATLMRQGVSEVIVCAGARNAVLVAVLARSPGLRVWSFPEERSAAFFALGRTLTLAAPVAVVTTSGTAVGELLPAAMEAYYQGLPLVLVTADRPRAYRGTGAPQAVEQPGIFTTYAALCGDVATLGELADFERVLAGWDHDCPVQLNVCLEEPSASDLAGATGVSGIVAVARPARVVADPQPVLAFLADQSAGPLLAVVAALPAGERDGISRFLQRLGCPVFAEATSGLRECPELARQLIHGGEAALARQRAGRVLRLGGIPSVRWWRDLEKQPAIRVLSLTSTGFPGLARLSSVSGFPRWDGLVASMDGGLSLCGLEAAGENPEAAANAQTAALMLHPGSEPALIHALSSRLPHGALVFLGNSLPIREWNSFATTWPRGLRCYANRGANGIDGCLSTFLGLSADEPESWAVIGDLTALYDLAALWITPSLAPGRRRIVVINNGGGRIFSRVAATRDLPPEQRQLMENPHALNFHGWAGMFGWAHVRVMAADDWTAALALEATHAIIEVVPDDAATAAFWRVLSSMPPAEGGAAAPQS
jgi:2-succinyl-5-enolpyruvyl-6-hydroxy-3-cyclohexene-1-carboxylate synthase